MLFHLHRIQASWALETILTNDMESQGGGVFLGAKLPTGFAPGATTDYRRRRQIGDMILGVAMAITRRWRFESITDRRDDQGDV